MSTFSCEVCLYRSLPARPTCSDVALNHASPQHIYIFEKRIQTNNSKILEEKLWHTMKGIVRVRVNSTLNSVSRVRVEANSTFPFRIWSRVNSDFNSGRRVQSWVNSNFNYPFQRCCSSSTLPSKDVLGSWVNSSLNSVNKVWVLVYSNSNSTCRVPKLKVLNFKLCKQIDNVYFNFMFNLMYKVKVAFNQLWTRIQVVIRFNFNLVP